MEQSASMNQSASMKQSVSVNGDNKDKKPPSLFDILDDSHLYLHPKSEKCVFNEYGQCIKGFRYFCAYCNYGVGGLFSSCGNCKCDIPKYDTFKSDEK